MAGAMRSIGQVLEIVRPEFPDISISKIRYLEAEGLLSPDRDQPSGYRRYATHDIERLRYILREQRDRFLPLRIIRENLARMDRGLDPLAVTTDEPPVEATKPVASTNISVEPVSKQRQIRLTRRELLEKSGLSEATFIELERHRIIVMRRGTAHYGRDALTIAVAARRLAAYGIDSRHLRLLYQAAQQEAGLIEQALTPYTRQRASSVDVVADVVRLVMHAHAAMLKGLINH